MHISLCVKFVYQRRTNILETYSFSTFSFQMLFDNQTFRFNMDRLRCTDKHFIFFYIPYLIKKKLHSDVYHKENITNDVSQYYST